MRNVLYFSLQQDDPTSFYRMSGVLPYIKHPELNLKDIAGERLFTWATFAGWDTFIIQRPFSIDHVKIIKVAKDMGLRIIADYDDNLLAVDMYNPTYKLYSENVENCKECIRLCDEVWVSTEGVKKAFSEFNENLHVIPNAHNDYIFKVEDKKEFNLDSKLAVWRGGGSHEADVYSYQQEITDLINNNKDWEFRFLGSRFPAIELHTGSNHTIAEPFSLIQFFKYLQEINPAIVFFPLRSTEFNKCKSNISWIEATYAGSAFFSNTDLPEFFTLDVYEYLLKKESSFINKQDLLKQMNEDSWEYIKDNLLLSKVNNKRIERLLSLEKVKEKLIEL